MLDSQVKAQKLPADQTAKAAQIATRNRELDIRQQENALQMVQKNLEMRRDIGNMVSDRNTKLSIEASKRLMEDAKLRAQERIAKMKPKSGGK